MIIHRDRLAVPIIGTAVLLPYLGPKPPAIYPIHVSQSVRLERGPQMTCGQNFEHYAFLCYFCLQQLRKFFISDAFFELEFHHNVFLAEALPWTPLGELKRSPRPPNRLKGVGDTLPPLGVLNFSISAPSVPRSSPCFLVGIQQWSA